jgi:hypothetical protein
MTPALFIFRPPYAISGESGKAWGVTRQDLGDLGVTAAGLTYRSLDADVLQVVCEGSAAPEYLQQISLWDAAGTRVFQGVCTNLSEEWDGAKLKTTATISGPWWWLEQVQLTSILTDGLGNDQERPAFTFPSQDLAVSIRALVTRLAEMGLPLQMGEIDQTFQVPQMQFQNGTGDSVLTTMLQWVPDCSTRFRYDTPLPTLDVIRRPSAPVVTYDLTADDNRAGLPRIQEQRQLLPSQITVQTMNVDTAGQIVYGQDTAGDPAPSNPLGRQILALSGPGRSDFRSYTPRISTLRTTTMGTYAELWSSAQALDPTIGQAEVTYGTIPWTSIGDNGSFPTLPRPISGVGTHRIVEGQVVDFMVQLSGVVVRQTRVSGLIFATYPSSGGLGALPYLQSIGRASYGFSGGTYNAVVEVDFTVPTVNIALPVLTVYVHPDDRALVTPVPGLAANLFAAQNYVPVQGSLPLYPGADLPMPGHRVNIRGGLPKWTNMGAMTSALEVDLTTGQASASLGRGAANPTNLINQFSSPLNGKIVNI